jgi:hypothetical protein
MNENSVNDEQNLPNNPPSSASGAPRHLTPSTADNNSFESGAGAGSAGFDAPPIGSLNLDNPEVDLGGDEADNRLDSRSNETEFEGYEPEHDE